MKTKLIAAALVLFFCACDDGAGDVRGVDEPADANETLASDAGSAPADAGPAATSGEDAAAGFDAGDALAPACGSLENIGDDVPVVADDGVAPAAAGGVIASGTYVLVDATVYTGPGGATGPTGSKKKMTIRVVGTNAESIFDGVNRTATWLTMKTVLHTTGLCPDAETADVPYTATASTLTIQLANTNGTLVYVFAKSVQ